ncbi:MAG: hypothetical protein HRT86_00095 [Ilumatobacteraceae bacterium]|nr:hypothetical protein [Ilumatobacteraceae bacterium]
MALAAAPALLVAACGSDDDATSPGDGATSTSVATRPSTVAPTGGWIDGEPEWAASESRSGLATEAESAEIAAASRRHPSRAGSVDDNAD